MASQFKKEDRRNVLPGFPKDFIFTDPEKLNQYLTSEKIVCLLCGKEYKALNSHLPSIHDIVAEDYKEMFGIPFTRGLVSAGSRQKYSENALERVKQGTIGITDEARQLGQTAIRDGKIRKRQPIRDVYSMNNIEILNKDCERIYASKKALATKRGTPEFYEMMKNRSHLKTEKHLEHMRKICKYPKPRKNKTKET